MAGQGRQWGDAQLVRGGGQLAARRGVCQQCTLHLCVTMLLQYIVCVLCVCVVVVVVVVVVPRAAAGSARDQPAGLP